jgi:hypothetical protein
MRTLSLDTLHKTFAHQRHTGQLFQEAVHELGFLDDAQHLLGGLLRACHFDPTLKSFPHLLTV